MPSQHRHHRFAVRVRPGVILSLSLLSLSLLPRSLLSKPNNDDGTSLLLYCIASDIHRRGSLTAGTIPPTHNPHQPQTLQLRYLPICLPIYLPRTSVCRSWSSRGPASPPPDPPPPPPLTTTTPPSSSTLGPTRAGSTRWHATPTVPPTRRAPAARSPRSPPRPLSVRGICPGGTAPLLPRSPGSSPRLSTAISRPPA